jgi:hypothetical protein
MVKVSFLMQPVTISALDVLEQIRIKMIINQHNSCLTFLILIFYQNNVKFLQYGALHAAGAESSHYDSIDIKGS